MKRRNVFFAAAGAAATAAVAFCAYRLYQEAFREEETIPETGKADLSQVKEERTASMEERHHEAAACLAETLGSMKADGEYQEEKLDQIHSALDNLLKEESGV